MNTRIWDEYLSEQDRAHIAAAPRRLHGFGSSGALLLIDNFREEFGDEPEPLLESVKKWPASMGMASWDALPRVEALLRSARANGIPVVHATQSDKSGVAVGASLKSVDRRRARGGLTGSAAERERRKYDLMGELTPIDGEALITKIAPSAFFGTPLMSHLNDLGVDTVVVAGAATSGCVRATVVDAASYRLRVVVAEECVYDRHQAPHAISLFDMSQKYADVISQAEVESWFAAQSA